MRIWQPIVSLLDLPSFKVGAGACIVAASLLLGSGACSSAPEPAGNTGGSGGQPVGGGGDGGASEPTPSIVCNGIVCQAGETCGEFDRCDCDPEMDNCEGGKVCLPIGRRCGFLMGKEGEPCDQAGQLDPKRNLECGLEGARLQWLRLCSTSDDCLHPATHCASDGYCRSSLCGDERSEAVPNGGPFGKCDPVHGVLGKEEDATGTCLPEGEGFSCRAAGSAGIGAPCRPGGSRLHPEMTCALGLHCPSLEARAWVCQRDSHCLAGERCNEASSRCEMKPCVEDADCGDPERNHCGIDGRCALTSVCREVCDGGTAIEKGEFSGCERGFCRKEEGSQPQPHAALTCTTDCNPQGGARVCPVIGGRPQICEPWHPESRQRLGTCESTLEAPAALGENCRVRPCETGTTCVGWKNEYICLALCCEEKFSEKPCPMPPPPCIDFQPCVQLVESQWGVCLPR